MNEIIKHFDELKAANNIDDRIQLIGGEGDLPLIDVATGVGRGSIYLHGAHVSHWQPNGKEPVLFMSKASQYKADKAIRGGVPLVFPWFGAHATDKDKPSHGFARIRPWSLKDLQLDGEDAVISLLLEADDDTKKLWPHDFRAVFTARFGRQLAMTLRVTNIGKEPFLYEEAMHTYFTVSDIHHVTATGLANRTYIDQLDDCAKKTQSDEPICFAGETDNIFIDSPDTVNIHDGDTTISISKSGSQSTIVWNPWIDKSKRMADFGDDEWPNMLCIETANAKDNAVTLKPGDAHEMKAVVEVSEF